MDNLHNLDSAALDNRYDKKYLSVVRMEI